MRIALEAQRIFRPNKGGMDEYAIELISHLPALFPEIDWLVFVRPGPDDKVLPEFPNLQVIPLSSTNYLTWEQIALPRALKTYRPDLVHATSNTAPFFCPSHLVITLHDLIFMDRPPTTASWYQRMGRYYRKWLVPKVTKKANGLLTVSHHSAKQIQSELGREAKVVYHGSAPFWNQPPVETPDPYFLFLGNKDGRKNVTGVLSAFQQFHAHHPEVTLWITGLERSWVLQQLGTASTLKNSIQTPGFVDKIRLRQLYHNALGLLYPSFNEGFGLPIIEAFAGNCPVITSSGTGTEEVAGEAAILIDPQKPAEVAAAMENLYQQPSLRSTCQVAGKQRAQAFSWQLAAKETAKMYFQVLGRHPNTQANS
ncbi:MAG: glycosyltransferase family 1 protein [Bacteroidota bacterium]